MPRRVIASCLIPADSLTINAAQEVMSPELRAVTEPESIDARPLRFIHRPAEVFRPDRLATRKPI